MPELRDGTIVEDPRLDRIPSEPDERDQRFSVAPIVGGMQEPVTVMWDIPAGQPVLDQGREGACVGFGCTNELRFNPVPVDGLDATFAREKVYWPAQKIDPWAGGAYPGAYPNYEGTSLRAGLKIVTQLGYVGEYRWARNESEIALAISAGPVILATDWFQSMSKPRSDGYITASGKLLGGHCYLAIGLKVTTAGGYYTIYNSWGPSWGKNGTAKLSRASLAKLMGRRGEAALITQRLNPPQPR